MDVDKHKELSNEDKREFDELMDKFLDNSYPFDDDEEKLPPWSNDDDIMEPLTSVAIKLNVASDDEAVNFFSLGRTLFAEYEMGNLLVEVDFSCDDVTSFRYDRLKVKVNCLEDESLSYTASYCRKMDSEDGNMPACDRKMLFTIPRSWFSLFGKHFNKTFCVLFLDEEKSHTYDSLRFSFFDLPGQYTRYMNLYNFSVYKQDSPGDDSLDYANEQSLLGVAVPCDDEFALNVICVINLLNKNSEISQLEMIAKLFDGNKRLCDERLMRADISEEGYHKLFYSIMDLGVSKGLNQWTRQTVMIEIEIFGQIIVRAPFEFREKDWEAVYQLPVIQPKLNIGGRKIVNVGDEDYDNAMNELNSMVGLNNVKKMIEDYRNTEWLNREREAQGLPVIRCSLHAIFIGNPGTGKTTVAVLLGKIFKGLGLLSKGHVVVEERATLVGQFYGVENERTNNAIEKSQGGILLIDEAYNLFAQTDPKDPGIRVIETLLTSLSDPDKRDWMLVLAGYPTPMSTMLSSNQGLRSRIKNVYYFNDYSSTELMDIADLYCNKHIYTLSPEARRRLSMVVQRECSLADSQFGNARFIEHYLENEVLLNMARRLMSLKAPSREQLITIEADDVPIKREMAQNGGFEDLKNMIGMDTLKANIQNHINFVSLMNLRMNRGIPTDLPPLHMIFTGSPGTGKSSIAKFIGKIYGSMGILSRGNVVKVERKDLVGAYIGHTEMNTENIMRAAKGNVLFIDEAYTLFSGEDSNDFGKNVMQTMLGTLGNAQVDMIVIMAGYKEEMDKLLDSNPGLRSRFPYSFHFDDYSVDELCRIAESIAKQCSYILTPSAKEALRAMIMKELDKKEKSFGNGRFVYSLINNTAAVNMANRLVGVDEKNLSKQKLKTMVGNDFPLAKSEVKEILKGGFNEKVIVETFAQLDAMEGMAQVKKTLHHFVEISRYRSSCNRPMVGEGLLRWSFSGKDGTGKSTVAKLLARLLAAMHLLGCNEVAELKGEDFVNSSSFEYDELLNVALQNVHGGMLFVDGDAPILNQPAWLVVRRQLETKITLMAKKSGFCRALVIAEREAPRQTMVEALAKKGAYDFDHTLVFEDYTVDELLSILKGCIGRQDFTMSDAAMLKMKRYIASLHSHKSDVDVNARTMKLLSRTVCDMATLRLARNGGNRVVEAEDVEMFSQESVRSSVRRIGY